MVISPNDFSLWARLTGNKYPSTPKERAQKGPEVQNFIQNLDKEGMIGGKEADKKEKKKGLPEKLATGALIAGGVAAAVAAGRDKRVQDIAQRAAANTKTKIDDFLVNFAPAQDVDVDIVNASGDVTPDPRQQQANVAPQLTGTSAAGRLTSLGSNQVRDPELGLVTFDRSSTPEEINNALTSIKMDRRLDRKAREGNLTRKDERQFLKKELTRSGMTAKELLGNDTIEGYLDRMEKEGAFKPVEQYISSKLPTDNVLYPDGIPQRKEPVGVSSFQQNISKDNYTPLVQGETSFTEGGISKEDPYGDISNLEKRVDRTYGNVLNKLKPTDAAVTRSSLIREARKARDFDLGYMNAMARGRTDEDATITGRKFGGYDLSPAVRAQTPYRKALSELKIASTVPAKIDELLNLVKTGPIINLPESVQEGGALVQLASGSTPSNKVPTIGATIGGPTLTDQLATENVVDNVLDDVRKQLSGDVSGPVPITGITSTGLKTFVQDDNLRRMEPTPEAVRSLTEPKQEFSPEPPSDPTSLDARIDRLSKSLAETRAMSENLGRAGELLSQSSTGVPGSPSVSILVPGTTRFDSARAAGLTSRSGITPRITSSNFQENVNLGKTVEAALPTSKRIFYRTDLEGRPIPESVQERDERSAITTIPKGGGGRKAGETAGPPKSPLDTLIIQAQNPAGTMTTTRPVFEEIDNTSNKSFVNPVQSGGLELSPPDFGAPSVSGRSIGKYGVELGDFPQAREAQTPTESPSSFTQAPGRARRPVDIVVSGGRANNNEFDTRTGGGYEGFKAKIDNIINQMGIPEGKTINIVSGGASGVDSYAAQYANEKQQQGANFTSEVMKADWNKGGTLPPPPKGQKPVADVNFDPAAGPKRNQKMINKAEAAIIFDGGSGTGDFTRRVEREQKTRRFPVYNASDVGGSKNRFAGESFDVARQLQKIQTDQSVSPSQRRINADNFIKDLETDTILRSID